MFLVVNFNSFYKLGDFLMHEIYKALNFVLQIMVLFFVQPITFPDFFLADILTSMAKVQHIA